MLTYRLTAIVILTLLTPLCWAQDTPSKQAPVTSDVVDCSSKKDPCGLSGVPSDELLCSLGLAISDIGNDRVGFPVDILAAAYGIEDKGKGFSPGFWHVRASKIEEIFSRNKKLMVDPPNAPALVALDIPGVGPRIYDADLARALISTELFEYPMHVAIKGRQGAKVSYVLLNSSVANSVRAYLSQSLASACSLGQSAPKRDQDSKQGSVSSAVTTRAFFAAPYANMRYEDVPAKAAEHDKDLPKDIKTLLQLAGTEEYISVNKQPCALWSEIAKTAHPANYYPDSAVTGCEFSFDLLIPRRTASAYSKLELSAEIVLPDKRFIRCEPKLHPDERELRPVGDTLVSPSDCNFSPLKWVISGDILQLNRPQPFLISVQRPTSVVPIGQDDSERALFSIRYTLEGTAKPWWKDWWERADGSYKTKHSAQW